MVSRCNTSVRAALCTSTTGVSPETVTVSSSAPTDIWPSTVSVKFAWSSRPSWMKVEKPGSAIVTA